MANGIWHMRLHSNPDVSTCPIICDRVFSHILPTPTCKRKLDGIIGIFDGHRIGLGSSKLLNRPCQPKTSKNLQWCRLERLGISETWCNIQIKVGPNQVSNSFYYSACISIPSHGPCHHGGSHVLVLKGWVVPVDVVGEAGPQLLVGRHVDHGGGHGQNYGRASGREYQNCISKV